MTYKENQQVLNLQVTDGLAVAVIQNPSHEFLMPVKDVATGYGVSAGTVRDHLSKNLNEFVYGKHYVKGVDIFDTLGKNAQPHAVYWTKAGIVRLGFFIKSERAKQFRNWAENLILQVSAPQVQLPPVKRRNHNRLSPERLLDIMADVCLIEDTGLRLRIANKLKGGAE
ncbi:Bro-N domain-containing protein [Pedobacter sp. BS3]|uniref:BRO-N domain-containing protein n=1 Tax=Pedobacter sp. BS3 TaxID=2567937 RepID=UPI0011ED5B13|nr:Bro-N domain-containing protein [Pedobacter sp. BS3]TZF81803.1 Bro-N domain-containing protein [Pedobacter sp. BS3]